MPTWRKVTSFCVLFGTFLLLIASSCVFFGLILNAKMKMSKQVAPEFIEESTNKVKPRSCQNNELHEIQDSLPAKEDQHFNLSQVSKHPF